MNSARYGSKKMSAGASAAAVWSLLLVFGAVPASAVTIDDFSTAQSLLTAPPDVSSTVAGAGIIGGQRDLEMMLLAGAGPVTAEVTGGQLQLRITDTTPDSQGRTVLTWDGDADPDSLDPVGLGGLDLTAGDHTGFRLTIDAAGAGAEVVFNVYTDGANASRAALVLPAVAVTTTFDLSYTTFAPSLGAGADFTDVGAITMSVTGVEQDVDAAMLETAGPAVILGDAQKIDTLVVDNDGDGKADPGDTLRYTITITNTGTEATSVNLDDVIQPNLSAVADSLVTNPIAAPDTYLACGNLTLAVDGSPGLPGLTANDHDPDGEAFSIATASPLTTDQGGTVDIVDPDAGTFDYIPPAGFRGVDTFDYEIQDVVGRPSIATVTLMVDSLVWFVDNTASVGGSGQQTAPFTTLGEAEAASGPGDVIFVHAGAGDTGDGITLKDRQQLIGEGAGLVACGNQIVPPGAFPTIVNPSSTVIRLANGNRIAGLNIEPQGSEVAIVGTLFEGLDVIEVGIDTSRGGASNGGVDLTDATGTVLFDQLTITGTGTGSAFTVTGGAPQLSVTNSTITPSGGSLLQVDQVAGGTIDFPASTTLSLAGGTGDAVFLSNNTSTVSIATLGSLTTGFGAGLRASNGGTLMLENLGSISATDGPALSLTGTAVGKINPGTLTFPGLASSNSSSFGVLLDGVANPIRVSGATVVAGSASHGVQIVGPNGAVTFASVDIDGTGGAGVALSGNTGAVEISGGSVGGLTPPTNNAIDIDGGAGDVTVAADVIGGAMARSVEVTNRTGGTVTFVRNVTGSGLGVNLTTNGAGTITFAGNLDLDTGGNTAFNATGGGTVNVAGATNTIDTATGVGVNIQNTTIGGGGVTFYSVSVLGASNGIVLANTGGGAFEVTGDGPSNPVNTVRGRITVGTGGAIVLGSGGSLIDTTGDAVVLNNAANVSLRNLELTSDGAGSRDGVEAINGSDGLILDNMWITGFSDNGLRADAVTGVMIQHCEIEGNAKSTDSVAADEANLRFDNVFGTATVANSIIRDVFKDNIRVSSCEAAVCGGPTLDLTLDNVEVADTLPGAGGNAGVLVRSFNDADVNLTVDNCDLVRNRSSAIQHNTNDPSTGGSTTVTNSTINRNANAINLAHQGATHTFNIDSNQINTVNGTPANVGNAVNIYMAALSTASSLFQGHVTGNTIGDNATADSGSETGQGIELYASGAGTLTANVTGNTVRALGAGSAFRAVSGNHTGTINLTAKTNDFSVLPTTLFPLAGLELNAGLVGGDTGTMCADILGNTAFIGHGSAVGAYIMTFTGTPTVNLVGYGGAANNATQIETFLDSAAATVAPPASGSSWTLLFAGTVQGQGAACPQPPPP